MEKLMGCDLVLIGHNGRRRLGNNFQLHASESFPDHAELVGCFFADIDLGAPVGNAAVSDADEHASPVRKACDADESTERQAIVSGG